MSRTFCCSLWARRPAASRSCSPVCAVRRVHDAREQPRDVGRYLQPLGEEDHALPARHPAERPDDRDQRVGRDVARLVAFHRLEAGHDAGFHLRQLGVTGGGADIAAVSGARRAGRAVGGGGG